MMNSKKQQQNKQDMQSQILKGQSVYLRAMEMDDLSCLYTVENEESLWPLGYTTSPYSKDFLKQYLESSRSDVFADLQLRLMICRNEDQAIVGIIDLIDFIPKFRRAQVGIVISEKYRGLGYGKDALLCLIRYSKSIIRMRQLHAEIPVSNVASLSLFKSCGFITTGLLKDWVIDENNYADAELLQLINEEVGL